MHRKAYFCLIILVLLSSCKTAKRSVTTQKTPAKSHGVSKPSTHAIKTSSRYPAVEYYGDSWNTEHVRYSSDPKPSGTVHLNMIPSGTSDFVIPACGRISSEFGPRNGSMHTGIDVKVELNDPVYCAFDGMVRMATTYSAYGKMVVVRHENGLETLYSHLNTIAVKVNQRVKAGDRIGGGGKTGRATGVHLHFETRFKGEPFNPRLVIDFEKCRLKTNTLVLNEDSYKLYNKNLQLASSAPKQPAKEKQEVKKTAVRPVRQVEHVVVKGDTLYNISQRYGTTVDSLRRVNNLSQGAAIQIGQKLVVETNK
ncbi:MAG: peptidoglycan DD-metalloendopeptidase family protein [Bacteroidales bacterium]|jgi:murein DD-endopeptidase MepM/ murein hydrolase activator NlpD|nr:peptidoglycan DD-metalloendopeptidase family protein [Bacteroidales bacterium]